MINDNYLMQDSLNSWGPLDFSTVPTGLYDLAYTEYQKTPSTVYHDITSGYNARYSAGKGYDLVTGLGSPIASNLVQYLTTWSLPASSGPSSPFTSMSPTVQGSASTDASRRVQVASLAQVAAIPQAPPVNMQAVLVGLPAASPSPTAVAPAPSLLGGPALGAQTPSVATARPAQPVPQGATTLVGTSLAPPRYPVPTELPASDPRQLTPLEIEAMPATAHPRHGGSGHSAGVRGLLG